ncbi:hypothetical protein NGB24_07780 [Mammaliicoccus vitulinus]|nr:hypothetical protein [Mammaliicoccus vitulinus]MEB7657755.1 hypothetical protein [Mammaliicoccus vitulinus]
MKIIFKLIFKKLFNFVKKEENLKLVVNMFIKFFYEIADQLKKHKESKDM